MFTKTKKGNFAKYFLVLALITSALLVNHVENRRTMKYTGIRCVALDEKFGNFTMCRLKAVQRDLAEITIRAILLQKPVKNAQVYFKVNERGFEHRAPILELYFDWCVFFSGQRRNPLAALFYKVSGFGKYSNMNHTCPYNHDFALEKYRFDENDVLILPFQLGHYSLLVTIYSYKIPRANITLNFQYIQL